MKNKEYLVEHLKKYINQTRDMRKESIKSDDLSEEQLYYLQEGYREGLCSVAMMLADELDAECCDMIYENYDTNHLEREEQWWHTHNDETGDIGTEERL
jgi:uncharacterized protein YutE (UPF0331/DUF86 family)